MKSARFFLIVLSAALLAAGIFIILATLYVRANPNQVSPPIPNTQVAQSQCVTMSNEEFARAAILALGITIPKDQKKLSAAELFQIRANMLTERGVDYFINSDRRAMVIRDELCSVLQNLNGTVAKAIDTSLGTSSLVTPYYHPLRGYVKASSEVSNYAQQFGCVTGTLAKDTACADEIITALNNPVYAIAVAEVYSSPGEYRHTD